MDQSDVTISLAASGQVAEADGFNLVRMSFSTNQSEKMAAAAEFHLSNLRSAHAPDLIGSLESAHANVVDSPVVTQRTDTASARAEADERLLNGYTTEAILTAAFAKDGDTAPKDRYTALFRQRPEAASAAVAMLMKDGPKRSVTDALGAAGSPSPVETLDGLAHETAALETLRADAILAFVQMQHPSAEAMRAPGDLLNDTNPILRSAARMISGALSRAGRAEHPREAAAIDDSLIALYRSAHDLRERVELLGALGNSAGSSAVPVVEEALHDSIASVRAAAARALRLAQGSEIDRILATVTASDPAGPVRSDAIFAIRFHHSLSSSLADSLLQAASTDEARYVRSDAIAVLGQNPTASPRIPEILERIAKQDADAGIRRQARETLEGMSSRASTHPE